MTIYEIVGLIVVIVQITFLPWAVYVTRSINAHDKEIAVSKALSKQRDEKIEGLESELKEDIKELKKKIDDMPLQIVSLIKNTK